MNAVLSSAATAVLMLVLVQLMPWLFLPSHSDDINYTLPLKGHASARRGGGPARRAPPPSVDGVGKGVLITAWASPLYRVDIGALGVDTARLNDDLAASILHHYKSMLALNPELTTLESGGHALGTNELFFQWQLREGWTKLYGGSEGGRELEELMHRVTDHMLRSIGFEEHTVEHRARQVHAWATVHKHCISHLSHTHPGHLISGVYYVKLPEDAGSIVFHDPRGPLPPFDQKIIIHPREGEMIVFPSWLLHEVLPTAGDEERMSVAFNMHGEWAQTADVSTSRPLPLSF